MTALTQFAQLKRSLFSKRNGYMEIKSYDQNFDFKVVIPVDYRFFLQISHELSQIIEKIFILPWKVKLRIKKVSNFVKYPF